MKLGKAIQTLRKEKYPNLSQKEFGDKIGLTQEYVSMIENDKKPLVKNSAQLIADALDVPVQIIFMLSLEEVDFKLAKRKHFNMFIKPTIEKIIEELI